MRNSRKRKAQRHRPYTTGTLWLSSADLDPEFVTKTLRINPDNAWRKGEAVEGHRTLARTGAWKLESGLPLGALLRDHVKAILDQLRPARRRFKRVRGRVERCYLGVTLGCDERTPVAWDTVPAPLLGELHALDIDLEFTAMGSLTRVIGVRKPRSGK